MQTEKTKSVPGLILPQPDFFNTPHPFFGTAITVPSKGTDEQCEMITKRPTQKYCQAAH